MVTANKPRVNQVGEVIVVRQCRPINNCFSRNWLLAKGKPRIELPAAGEIETGSAKLTKILSGRPMSRTTRASGKRAFDYSHSRSRYPFPIAIQQTGRSPNSLRATGTRVSQFAWLAWITHSRQEGMPLSNPVELVRQPPQRNSLCHDSQKHQPESERPAAARSDHDLDALISSQTTRLPKRIAPIHAPRSRP